MYAMQRYAGTLIIRGKAMRQRGQPWQHSHPRDNRPTNGTYGDTVASSQDVSRVRFARFVARALADARHRGMNDKDIAEATGVGVSTFHRWQRGDFSRAPEIGRVRAFCDGLGIPARAALLALGVGEGRDDPAPEPVTDPDIRRILRALNDPNVSDQEKLVIREMLKMIAHRSPDRTPKH
jgi:transcriptional regulator with XRE-family HTH domain